MSTSKLLGGNSAALLNDQTPRSSSNASGALGLPNRGNTCYLNSVLQCLFHTRSQCLETAAAGLETAAANYHRRRLSDGDRLRYSLGEFFGKLLEDYKTNVMNEALRKRGFTYISEENPWLNALQPAAALALHPKLKSAPPPEKHEMEDAEDFLFSLLDALFPDNPAAPDEGCRKNGWRQMCGLTKQEWSRCDRCQDVSKIENEEKTIRVPLQEGDPVTLDQLLPSVLRQREKTEEYCKKCRANCTFTKCSNMIDYGDVIPVSLTRSAYSGGPGNYYQYKIKRKVDIPEFLNLENGAQYSLFGVVSHNGDQSNTGHYIASVRSRWNDRWYHCNDRVVTETEKRFDESGRFSFTRLSRRDGYDDYEPSLLFYHRSDRTPADPVNSEKLNDKSLYGYPRGLAYPEARPYPKSIWHHNEGNRRPEATRMVWIHQPPELFQPCGNPQVMDTLMEKSLDEFYLHLTALEIEVKNHEEELESLNELRSPEKLFRVGQKLALKLDEEIHPKLIRVKDSVVEKSNNEYFKGFCRCLMKKSAELHHRLKNILRKHGIEESKISRILKNLEEWQSAEELRQRQEMIERVERRRAEEERKREEETRQRREELEPEIRRRADEERWRAEDARTKVKECQKQFELLEFQVQRQEEKLRSPHKFKSKASLGCVAEKQALWLDEGLHPNLIQVQDSFEKVQLIDIIRDMTVNDSLIEKSNHEEAKAICRKLMEKSSQLRMRIKLLKEQAEVADKKRKETEAEEKATHEKQAQQMTDKHLEAQIAELTSKKEKAVNDEELPAARRALGAAKFKLAELKALKAQKLLEEDFAVLIRLKIEIQEQEAEVQKLQQKVKSLTVKGSGFADIADSGHQAPASTHLD